MNWLVFSYSLPSKLQSSPRVTLWRRLGRLGAIAPKAGVYVLPARDECIEAFQWLAQEVQQVKGEALILHVERFEGLNDSELIELFREARKKEYAEINTQALELEKSISAKMLPKEHHQAKELLAKLRKQYAEITRVDFFDCPEGIEVASRLTRIEQSLSPKGLEDATVATAAVAEYRDKRWVTRPRPHVDRLACAWLIRRFINPDAIIRYSQKPKPDEVAFDMSTGVFGHRGNLCSLEVMLATFGLDKPGLRIAGEIVHELDLRDGRYLRPETVGIDAVLKGWLLLGLTDLEIESRGISLFDGLYASLSREEKG